MKRRIFFAIPLIATWAFALSYYYFGDAKIGADDKSVVFGFPANNPAVRGKQQQPLTEALALSDDVLLDMAFKHPELINRQHPNAPRLVIPVKGVNASSLVDTFTASRSSGRIHNAIDIMAPTGTPVLAALDGAIAKLFKSDDGGLTLYQVDANRTYLYYYAHLDDYADGIVTGKKVQQGEVIGYVGYSGNADADAPHLHFAIYKLVGNKQWWKGTVLNPYPLLTQELGASRKW